MSRATFLKDFSALWEEYQSLDKWKIPLEYLRDDGFLKWVADGAPMKDEWIKPPKKEDQDA